MSSEEQMNRREVEINGTPLSFETGKYAKQADGSVIVRMGDSVVLVTACASPNPREGIDFLPLTVDYKDAFREGFSSVKASRPKRKC